MAAVIVLWVSVAPPMAVTAMLGPALAVVCQVAPARRALASFAAWGARGLRIDAEGLDLRQRRFTFTWARAAGIDWIILLCGGGLALGDLVFETGLAAWLGTGLTSVLPARHGTGVDDRVRRRRHRLSDAASNAASADMIVPVAIAVALASDVSPLRPALAATLAPLSAGADRR